MVRGYADYFGLDAPFDEVVRDALEWATTRGARSVALLGSSPRISPAGLAAASTAKAEERHGGGPFLGPAAWF